MIRNYTPDDADAVISIWREASALAHPFLDDGFLQSAQTMIRDVFLDMAETWIAEHNDTPVGFVAALGDEIGGLFLRPSYHGQGIGRALLDTAMETRTRVELDVFKDNPIGRKFYASYGFTTGAERIDEMSGFPVLRLHYSKP